jgi:hypothetical protein
VHNLNADSLRVLLSNTAPNAGSHATRSQATELSTGGGYTSGGGTVASRAYSQTGGVGTLTGEDVVFTATAGGIGPFRYAIRYNDTPTSPTDPLIGWWDYGSSITLADGESLTVDFGASILTVT